MDSTARLDAALDALARDDMVSLPDASVRERLLGLLTAANRLQAELARTVAHFDTRGLSTDDGCRTVKSWLRGFARSSAGAAHALVQRSGLLRRLPELFAVAAAGQASAEHVDVVARLEKRVGPDVVAGCAPTLAAFATQLDPNELDRLCDRVRAHADPDGAEPDAGKDFTRRGLSWAVADGMLAFRGQLDPEGAAAFMSALDAFLRPPGAGDTRTPDQRRGDAMVDIFRSVLNDGGAPTVGGVRPQVGVLVRPENLVPHDSAMAPEPATMQWVGDVPDSLAQRMACDCDVWRVLLDPATGRPVDVGRAYRTVPHWIRKALWVRDRQCRFPGCHAPIAWTDAHHLTHWAAGGPTDLDNLLSLCRWHHGLVHEGGWQMRYDVATNAVTVTRPNGRPYDIRGRPPLSGSSTMDGA
jgi:hypothetical protein